MFLLAATAILISGATVVDGTGAPPRQANVLIRDGRIAAVGSDVTAPPGATLVDGSGHTLTPGLFDLHTHLPYSAVLGLWGDWAKILKAYLYCGVTSVVDFGTYPETFEPMRRLLSTGVTPGPRVYLAARVTTPGGHGGEAGRGDFFSLEVLTPDDARAAVSRLRPYRPDGIKIFTDGWRYGAEAEMTSMEEDTLAVIVAEAHKDGMEVLTHTVTLDRAKQAARAGVDVIEHGIGDRRVDAEFTDLARKSGTAYVSTLAVYEMKSGPLAPLLMSVLEPAAQRILGGRFRATRITPQRRSRWANVTGNVKALSDAGVAVAVGTDAGVTGAMHGWATIREVELMVEAGMTPLAAITAATGQSARAIHVDGERGTIEPGKLADLALFAGTPHTDIKHLERIARVWMGGVEVDRPAMQKAIATEGPTALPARRATTWIDDMEGERTRLDTLRVNATDDGHDNSRMIFQRTLRSAGNHALTIQARMSNKKRPYAQVLIPLSRGGVEPVDASRFRGIRFEARGQGSYGLIFQRVRVRDGKHPATAFGAGPSWKTVRIPLPPDPTDLTVLGFEIARGAGQQGWLELDNLRFY